MKKAVTVFIVSTMIMTGLSAKNGDILSYNEDDGKKSVKVFESSKEVPSASIEAIRKRFYAKYGRAEPEEGTGDFEGQSGKNSKTEETGTQKETGTEEVAQQQTQQQTEPQTQPETQTEPETETQPQNRDGGEQAQTEVPAETVPEVTGQPENIECSGGIILSNEDYSQLLKIVEAEAGNQDDVGKILVANVIFNRVRNSEFPNTVTEVIYQHGNGVYQFEPVLNGRIYEVSVADSTEQCVKRAIAGEDYSQGALYFTMRTSPSSWFNTKLRLLFVHGDHYFYTC